MLRLAILPTCIALVWIRAEGSRTDDGIRRVGIHIGDGKQIPVHADCTAFLRCDATEFLSVRGLPRRTERHRMGKHGCAEKARRQYTLFEVSGNQKRQLRFRLQAVEQHYCLVAVIVVKRAPSRRRRHGHRSDVIFANAVGEPNVLGIPRSRQSHTHANHEELTHFLFERKRAQSLLRPPLVLALEAVSEIVAGLIPRHLRRPGQTHQRYQQHDSKRLHVMSIRGGKGDAARPRFDSQTKVMCNRLCIHAKKPAVIVEPRLLVQDQRGVIGRTLVLTITGPRNLA